MIDADTRIRFHDAYERRDHDLASGSLALDPVVSTWQLLTTFSYWIVLFVVFVELNEGGAQRRRIFMNLWTL